MAFFTYVKRFYYAIVLFKMLVFVSRLSINGFMKEKPTFISDEDQQKLGLQLLSGNLQTLMVFAILLQVVILILAKCLKIFKSVESYLLIYCSISCCLDSAIAFTLLLFCGERHENEGLGIDYGMVYFMLLFALSDIIMDFITIIYTLRQEQSLSLADESGRKRRRTRRKRLRRSFS